MYNKITNELSYKNLIKLCNITLFKVLGIVIH